MIGKQIHDFAEKLWGINRSLTGEGVRETLNLIKDKLPEMKIMSVASGTKVFDWTVPQEWEVSEAYILAPTGEKICDFNDNNLHLVGYSIPFEGMMSLSELQQHLHSLPEQPDAIPYVTSYYEERWGFCIKHNDRSSLKEGNYRVVIRTRLFDGQLNYGELIVPGRSKKEVFLSTYVCHPSMANNELSGPTVVTFLSNWLQSQLNLNYTYRIIFIPETIGSIAYLSKNYVTLKETVIAGFNVSCVGDNRAYSYLPSRSGVTYSDRIAKHVLKWTDKNYKSYKWIDRGSDERQYCAPGIDLPIASIMRTKYGEYPEYHTSLDNLLDVVTPEGLDGGFTVLQRALELLENNIKYKTNVLGEPQMGKRGLYPNLSTKAANIEVRKTMNFLSFCDGKWDILDIAEELDVPAWELYSLAATLSDAHLITPLQESK